MGERHPLFSETEMPATFEEDFDEEYDDWSDEDEDSEVLPCPSCGAEVFAEAEKCPACGDWIVESPHTLDRMPTWWIVLGLLGVAATIWALAGGLL